MRDGVRDLGSGGRLCAGRIHCQEREQHDAQGVGRVPEVKDEPLHQTDFEEHEAESEHGQQVAHPVGVAAEGVVGPWLGRRPVPQQVRRDDGVALRQRGDHGVPRRVIAGQTVQEKHRRSESNLDDARFNRDLSVGILGSERHEHAASYAINIQRIRCANHLLRHGLPVRSGSGYCHETLYNTYRFGRRPVDGARC